MTFEEAALLCDNLRKLERMPMKKPEPRSGHDSYLLKQEERMLRMFARSGFRITEPLLDDYGRERPGASFRFYAREHIRKTIAELEDFNDEFEVVVDGQGKGLVIALPRNIVDWFVDEHFDDLKVSIQSAYPALTEIELVPLEEMI